MTQLFEAGLAGNAAIASAVSQHRIEICEAGAFEQLRPEWEMLQAAGTASAYQSWAFHKAWLAGSDAAGEPRPVFAVLRDQADMCRAILPLLITGGPLRIGRYPGGKHVNFNLPLSSPGFLPAEPGALLALVKSIGRAAGADVLALSNQPETWNGRPHPFAALGGQPSPSFAYKMALEADSERLIKAQMSQDARHKLRRKLNRLKDMGELRFARAQTPLETRQVLDAFLAQKHARMAAMGLPDPFREPGIEAFLRAGTSSENAAIQLFGLWIGERVVATYGAAVDERRFSGMFTSFDAADDVYRWSPGEHMLLWLIEEHCRLGLSTFDLGIGEARYKAQFCDEEERLFDLHIPITAKGHLAKGVMHAAGAAKRRLKQNAHAMGAIIALRKKLARKRA
jgi:CelD/BcsL family acetyltransferase involved in cellulose biosynthesis